ncbi:MAG: hypothetical protein DSY32_04710 [Aquifex sp.]|nr:MAG: hypothetical protein DSY32_04710 [Aquifex sp.]
MEFNPLTYLFEIINFFVLLLILNKILYKPVISVLKKRKRLLDEKFKEYDKIKEEINKLIEEKKRLISEVEKIKRNKLNEIIKEVEEERVKLYRKMEEELESERKKFYETLEKEKEELIEEIKESAVRTSILFITKLLSYFNDRNMHKKLFDYSLEIVKRLDIDENLREELKNLGFVTVETAFPLSEEEKRALRGLIINKFKLEVDLKEEVKKELIGGVRIRIASKIIDLSLKGQLKSLENLMREEIEGFERSS